MAEIRVTIFDDNNDIRDSLAILFNTTSGFVLGGAFSHAAEAPAYIEATLPDVVLMDIDMPGTDGIQALKNIRKLFPDLHVIMLTIFHDDDKIFDAICAGANGYVLKTKTLDEIVSAVREVVAGGSPMTPSIARKVLQLFQRNIGPQKDSDYNLTSREKEVLKFLVDGDSYKMIADKLKISYPTVNSHLTNIYRKLHVNSMGEAISLAIKNRLMSFL
jgi:DNA-binding NarL/FixJ family response regulator